MVEFIIGVGVGIIGSVAIAALILAFINRAEEPDVPQRRPARDYDRESRIAAARLRDFQERDMEKRT